MDSLRWVLLFIGVVVVAGVYLWGRYGRERASRPASQPRHAVEEHDTLTESITAEDDEPSVSDWAASGGAQSTHDPDAVGVDWGAAAKADLTTDELAEVAIAVEAEPPTHPGKAPTTPQADAPPALDIKPLVLVLTVMAADGRPWKGADLQGALEAEGLRHGDMNIFHFRPAERDDAVFSVANAVEPGVFDLAAMAGLETPGVTLFCQLPGPLAGDAAFDLMLAKARALAERLGGHVCDDRRNPLTAQTISHYHDRIETFARELAIARKKVAEK